jgi:hypothetical protein
MEGSLVLVWDSELEGLADPNFLDLALWACDAGWRAFVGADAGETDLVDMKMPCKQFRGQECVAMARRMASDGDGALVLNRDVLDLIDFLRRRDVAVMAFSDRPVEAAVIEPDDDEHEAVDLMTIAMATRGVAIARELDQAVP